MGQGQGFRERASVPPRPWYCDDTEIQHTEPCYVTHTAERPYYQENGAHYSPDGAYVAWRRHVCSMRVPCGTEWFVMREGTFLGIGALVPLVERKTPRLPAQRGVAGVQIARNARSWECWTHGPRGERVWRFPAVCDRRDYRMVAVRAQFNADRVPGDTLDRERYRPTPAVTPERDTRPIAPSAPRHDATMRAERCGCVRCVAFLADLNAEQRAERTRFFAGRDA